MTLDECATKYTDIASISSNDATWTTALFTRIVRLLRDNSRFIPRCRRYGKVSLFPSRSAFRYNVDESRNKRDKRLLLISKTKNNEIIDGIEDDRIWKFASLIETLMEITKSGYLTRNVTNQGQPSRNLYISRIEDCSPHDHFPSQVSSPSYIFRDRR